MGVAADVGWQAEGERKALEHMGLLAPVSTGARSPGFVRNRNFKTFLGFLHNHVSVNHTLTEGTQVTLMIEPW